MFFIYIKSQKKRKEKNKKAKNLKGDYRDEATIYENIVKQEKVKSD